MLPFPIRVAFEIAGYIVSEHRGHISVWSRPESGLSQIAGLIFRNRQGEYYSSSLDLQEIVDGVRQIDD